MISKTPIFTPITLEESTTIIGGNWLLNFNPADYTYTLKSLDDGTTYQSNSSGDLGSLLGSVGARNVLIESPGNILIDEFE